MNKKGFTLIELLVVIAIIGILSGIVLAALGTARSKGADAATESQLAGARAQAEIYANGGNYTTGAGAGVCSTAPGSNGFGNGTAGISLGAKNSSGAATWASSEVPAGPVTGAGAATQVTCHATNGAWIMEAPLKSPPTGMTMWCVDSSGVSKAEAVPMLGPAVNCL